jgi:isopropylmalate/homocitrate/citramalate synthase
MGLSGIEVPFNRPFIGSKAYSIESGIVTSWYKNAFEKDPTIVFPVHPRFVGHKMPEIVMGKKSGVDNIAIWSRKLGVKLNEDEKMAVLNEVKLRSHDLKRVLVEDEFKEIAKSVKSEK